MTYFAIALGTSTLNKDNKIIEAWYPQPILKPDAALTSALTSLVKHDSGNAVYVIEKSQYQALAELFAAQSLNLNVSLLEAAKNSEQNIVLTILENDAAPTSVAEGYLKLHLLSHRLVKPQQVNLDGLFGVLHNIAWTSEGPIDMPELPERQIAARMAGRPLEVNCIDKFPKMADYVVPSGIRIGDTSRVRLGAHLGEGTTVMHAGFVNFNAGTEAVSMVEGRVSAGVLVGNGSDVGGGASIMGTLSGGGKEVVSLGENCLLGANAGTGIALGDRCTIEAGLYITAGTKVTMLDSDKQPTTTVKARELSGKSDLLFWRNAQTGRVECLTNKSAIELNADLHSHN
ncbi:2,3,4,5-tetrahydropyridine-2,6-dicarboxylate N-succinyltransferase [Reinekea thalattae]|uniref:2,3,4,5-tetrahydropyridine-2,6-dicarboxylate N-succinyltransferase n=1 Tax=Reinekea thalattae TaxID=2593301 RepID=A0A5C8ZA94_9GAMM|nr:2,3,4,5-tetrahydropyridine-2,6-dicarboxylate N-succinyltransferase [Reinekea thalattae]TXR54088.1 2,3,4,5-tetrahydropyridine-2,6-dicarboxylate N-succinyltransferase [Reinekea thalattae]